MYTCWVSYRLSYSTWATLLLTHATEDGSPRQVQRILAKVMLWGPDQTRLWQGKQTNLTVHSSVPALFNTRSSWYAYSSRRRKHQGHPDQYCAVEQSDRAWMLIHALAFFCNTSSKRTDAAATHFGRHPLGAELSLIARIQQQYLYAIVLQCSSKTTHQAESTTQDLFDLSCTKISAFVRRRLLYARATDNALPHFTSQTRARALFEGTQST